MALKAERITGFPFLSETTQLEYRKVICALHTVPISLMNALLHERCQGDVARSILSNQLRRQRQKHKMFNASGLYCNGTGFRGGSSVCFRPRDCLGSCLGYSPESKFFLSNCLAFFPQWLCFCAHFRWRILLRAVAHVSFFPTRAGELVRTMMISSRSGLSPAYVLTTAVSERLVDAIALGTISGIVLLTITY
jgi:hypothetical protein